MSCCSGKCDCGSGCNCGSGCKRNPSLGLTEAATSVSNSVVLGVALVKTHHVEAEMSTEGGHGCKCGSNCSCDPCNC